MEPLRGQIKKNAFADWIFHKWVDWCNVNQGAEEWKEPTHLRPTTTRQCVRAMFPRLTSLDVEVKALVDEHILDVAGLDFTFLLAEPRDQPYETGYQAPHPNVSATHPARTPTLSTCTAAQAPHQYWHE